MGIHYTYGANKNAKLMEKKAKEKKNLQKKEPRNKLKLDQ